MAEASMANQMVRLTKKRCQLFRQCLTQTALYSC